MRIKDAEIKNFKDLKFVLKIYFKRVRLFLKYKIYSNKGYKVYYIYLSIILFLFLAVFILYVFFPYLEKYLPEILPPF